MADYTAGDLLPFSASVRNAAGDLEDAGAMTLTVTLDGTAVAGSPFTVASATAGKYAVDVPAPTAGLASGVWTATGNNAGTFKQRFTVASMSDLLFTSLEGMKTFLRIDTTDTTSDVLLEQFMGAATRTVEYRTGPIVPRAITERHWHGAACWSVMLRRPPGISITSVLPVDGSVTSVIPSQLVIDDQGRVEYAVQQILPYGRYVWTYLAGRRGEIPEDLTSAVQNMVKERWRALRGASAVPFTSNADDAWIPTQQDPLSPLVAALVRPYELPQVA
jgi:hypothetical protein